MYICTYQHDAIELYVSMMTVENRVAVQIAMDTTTFAFRLESNSIDHNYFVHRKPISVVQSDSFFYDVCVCVYVCVCVCVC